MAATGKRYQAEQVVNKLREIDVLAANGKTIPEVCKSLAISEQTYYRCRPAPRPPLASIRNGNYRHIGHPD